MSENWIPGIRFNYLSDGRELADKLGYHYYSPLTDIVVARHNAGKLMGGVIYTQCTGRGGLIMMHCAGMQSRWINRNFLFVAFDYPFNQIGVERLVAPVHEFDLHTRRFMENLGFQNEHVIKDGYPGEGMVLYTMTRQQCRFLNLTPQLASEPVDG